MDRRLLVGSCCSPEMSSVSACHTRPGHFWVVCRTCHFLLISLMEYADLLERLLCPPSGTHHQNVQVSVIIWPPRTCVPIGFQMRHWMTGTARMECGEDPRWEAQRRTPSRPDRSRHLFQGPLLPTPSPLRLISRFLIEQTHCSHYAHLRVLLTSHLAQRPGPDCCLLI